MALFKEMTDDGLREAFFRNRDLISNNFAIAATGCANLRRCAAQMERLMKNDRIMLAIAKKRRIRLY